MPLGIGRTFNRPGLRNPSLDDYLAFRKMVSPVLIQAVFWIGAAFCVIGGCILILSYEPNSYRSGGELKLFMGLVLVVLGPVLLRICCEFLIVLFRMSETLSDIRHLLGRTPP